jgi:hypothetical protein
MHVLQRTGAVLSFAAIAWLGTACERTDTPTEPGPSGLVTALATTTHWVNDNDPNGGLYVPPGTSCTDPGYMTITEAVAVSSSGDIIQVCEGNYTETVTILHPLTLLGPNVGIPLAGTRGPEATVTSPVTTFSLMPGDGVTIDGFTINGNIGIAVEGSSNGTLIQSNIITGGLRSLSLNNSVGSASSNASVLNNDLISNSRSLHLDGPHSNLKINGNRFSGPAAAPGIFFSALPPHPMPGFEFSNNQVLHTANMATNISNATVRGNTFDVAVPGDEMLLISLENSIVTENIFKGDDQIACLRLWGDEIPGFVVPSHHVTISENTFSDCGRVLGPTPSSNYAIQLGPDVHHIDIKNNEIDDGVEGVNTADETPWVVTQEIHINFNNITDNTSFGIRNGQSGILDGECNWWGAADGPGLVGPGSGDNVSNNVDFTPWLTAPAPGGSCVGGLGLHGMVTGGGQIIVDAMGGRGSFGFSAKLETQSGHLDYMNHVTRKHLNCTVTSVMITPPNAAKLSGDCSSKNYTGTFEAEVEDNGNPGKGNDKFKITYTGAIDGDEGDGTIRSGNIQIK